MGRPSYELFLDPDGRVQRPQEDLWVPGDFRQPTFREPLDEPTMVALRRPIGPQDQTRFHTEINGSLTHVDSQYVELLGVIPVLGVSAASPKVLRRIYSRGGYIEQSEGTPISHRFDAVMFAHQKAVNDANRSEDNPRGYLFAQLGGISIFGAKKGREGTRFVVATVVGEDTDILATENIALIERLLPNMTPEERDKYRNGNVPHISLVRTTDHEAAEAAAECLSKRKLKGMYVQFMPSQSEQISIGWRD